MSLSEDLSANMSQPLGLIPSFPQRSTRLQSLPVETPKALGLMSFGVRFDLSANQLELLRDALLHLPEGCKTSFSVSVSPHYSLVCRDYFSRTDEPTYRLYRNRRLLFSCTERRTFLERFRAVITLYVAESSRRRTFLRAAVIGWQNQAVIILGKGSCGKTTLLSQLVAAGATYYSDQFAVIDKHGKVYPYACPLQVRDDTRSTQRLIEEFGGVAGCEPLPVSLVMVSRYKHGARWQPRQLSPETGLSHMLGHAVSAVEAPSAAHKALEHIAAQAMVMHGVRGEASLVIQWLVARFGAPHILPGSAKTLISALRPTADFTF